MIYSSSSHTPAQRLILISLALVLLAIAAHGGCIFNDFIGYDDGLYVTDNVQVRGGLSAPGVAWAFSTSKGGNWNPVTWLSHMAVVELAGLAPLPHHLANLALHCGNAILLFLALAGLTGATWRSAMAAAIFAVHPIHVESVAWVAERKDVLSMTFALAAIIAHTCSITKPDHSRRNRIWALIFLALGLMAKPMLVTLPVLLLLFDYWPFRRTTAVKSLSGSWKGNAHLLYEKLPMFVVVGVFCVIALSSQSKALAPLDEWSVWQRVGNVLTSYVAYLGKLVWPHPLTPLYPLRKSIALWKVVSSGLILLLATWLIYRARRVAPYLLMGWLWYLAAMLPVVGIVQIGVQYMADRYAYLPFIGLYIAAVWGVHQLLFRSCASIWCQVLAGVLCLSILSACVFLSRLQTTLWHDTETLFAYTVEKTRNNYTAHRILGKYYLEHGDTHQALLHYQKQLDIRPNDPESYWYVASAYLARDDFQLAAQVLRDGLSKHEDSALLHKYLAFSLYKLGIIDEALQEFEAAHALALDDRETINNIQQLKKILSNSTNGTGRDGNSTDQNGGP
ncbi:tetratricopeptide repeat protein [Oceanidesulfovibrio marinus]|uniref:Tetratricopeptide repeat protein n=1 Tax=Oceanidesulfovibrio marinus TaxID=370038 RepID=A0ABX6NCQ9_9BACT|nr:tetratricopeptide repeat protein [Oceanidesulfovibrio marinus]QJT08370.1 tetratricopeptide repeat protein [Oceanidesulfovibrio marinus]